MLELYRGVEQLVARQAHNLKVGGSSPPPTTGRSTVRVSSSSCWYIMVQNVFGDSVALGRLVNRGRVVYQVRVFADKVIDSLVLNCI